MKQLALALVILFAAQAQVFSGAGNVVTIYSQNEQFYLTGRCASCPSETT